MRALLRAILRFLFSLLTHLDVEGLGHIPGTGPAIIAANHISILDAPLVFMLLERSDATGLVADKYLRNPFIRWLVNRVRGIWINRDAADLKAMRAAVEYLEEGGLLGIAPEGTRSHTAALSQAKTGVAFLAEKANKSIGFPIPIVPVAISGTDRAFLELAHWRRPGVRVTVGEPFILPALEKTGRAEALQHNTDEVMSRIAAMLPESYRGAYASHPRVLELVAAAPQTRNESTPGL